MFVSEISWTMGRSCCFALVGGERRALPRYKHGSLRLGSGSDQQAGRLGESSALRPRTRRIRAERTECQRREKSVTSATEVDGETPSVGLRTRADRSVCAPAFVRFTRVAVRLARRTRTGTQDRRDSEPLSTLAAAAAAASPIVRPSQGETTAPRVRVSAGPSLAGASTRPRHRDPGGKEARSDPKVADALPTSWAACAANATVAPLRWPAGPAQARRFVRSPRPRRLEPRTDHVAAQSLNARRSGSAHTSLFSARCCDP